MCSDTYVLFHLLRYFEMISSSTIFKTTYANASYQDNLKTPDICKSTPWFSWPKWVQSNREISCLFKKVVLGCLCDSNNRNQVLTNLRSSNTSSVTDIKSLELSVILLYCKHKTFQIPKSGRFKMTYVFQTAAEFTEITTNQHSVSTKNCSSTLLCSSSSFAIVARCGRLRLEMW